MLPWCCINDDLLWCSNNAPMWMMISRGAPVVLQWCWRKDYVDIPRFYVSGTRTHCARHCSSWRFNESDKWVKPESRPSHNVELDTIGIEKKKSKRENETWMKHGLFLYCVWLKALHSDSWLNENMHNQWQAHISVAVVMNVIWLIW